jgi:hypothetical protein
VVFSQLFQLNPAFFGLSENKTEKEKIAKKKTNSELKNCFGYLFVKKICFILAKKSRRLTASDVNK